MTVFNQNISPQKTTLFLFLFIGIIVFLAFLPSLFCEFTNWDDDWMLTNNPIVRKLTFDNIIHNILGSFYESYIYLPPVFLSYAIEYHFFGLNPFVYHLDNVILHILNTLLVFIFVNHLSANKKAALVACLFWSLNPLRVESVSWVTERKDLFYAFFYLLSLVKYVHYLKSGNKKIHLVLSLLFFFFSCLSKLAAVSLSFIIVLIDYFYNRKFDFRAILEKGFYFSISLAYGLFTMWAVKSNPQPVTSYFFPFIERVQIATHNLGLYFLKSVFPFNLSAWHPYRYPPGKLPDYYMLLFILSLFALLALFWFFKKFKNRKIIFGLLFFVSAVFFALQLISAGDAVFADRHIYISSIGIAFLMGELYLFLSKKIPGKTISSITLAILFIYGLLTYKQTKIWKNSITLFTDIIEEYPDDFVGYINRGATKYAAKDYAGALSDYEKGLKNKPAFYFNDRILMTMMGVGFARNAMKDHEGARRQFNKALKFSPGFPKAYFARGQVFFELGNFSEALEDFTKTIELEGKNSFQTSLAFTERGRTKMALKQYESAIKDLDSSLEIIPDNSDSWYFKGLCYYSKNEFEKAKADLLKAFQINPKHEIASFYLGLCEVATGNLKNGCDFFVLSSKLGHPDGKRMQLFYCGNPEIRKKMFYPDGKLKFQLIKIGDEKRDTVYYLCNFDSAGKRMQQGAFDLQTGKYNGEIRWYYSDGSLKKTGFSRNDTTFGVWKEFYQNGTIRAEYSYSAGELDGIYRHFYSNGNLWTERNYDKGLLMKVTACYDISGNPLKTGSFTDGNGSLNVYDEKSRIIMVQQYKKGLKIQ